MSVHDLPLHPSSWDDTLAATLPEKYRATNRRRLARLQRDRAQALRDQRRQRLEGLAAEAAGQRTLKRAWSPADIHRLHELRGAGCTWDMIARAYGTTAQAVSDAYKRGCEDGRLLTYLASREDELGPRQ